MESSDRTYISFGDLPKGSQGHLISALGLCESESEVLRLKYVMEYTYPEIAAEMNISEKSVPSALNRAKRHAVDVSRRFYELADDKSKLLIDELGWRELPWPVETNRIKHNRGEL